MAAERTDLPNHVSKLRSAVKEERVSWRLPLHHRHTLSDLFQGAEESRAGIRTRYIPDGSHGGSDDYVQLHDLERFVDECGWKAATNWRREIVRAHRALEAMREANEHNAASILAIVYGHPDPSIVRTWGIDVRKHFGDLAGLAKYTDACEQHRQQMVNERAGTLLGRPSKPIELGVVIAIRKIDQRRADADRSITSGDSIADVLDLHPHPKPRAVLVYAPHMVGSVYDAAVRVWKAQRAEAQMRAHAFWVEAKAEADRMLTEASRTYAEFWYSVR